MKVLIKQALIIDPQSPYNGSKMDILVSEGRIDRIESTIDFNADLTISEDQLQVSPGWMDVFSNFADPGFEFKETLETGAAAAAAGGYTDVFVIPNTKPCIDSKSQVEYILRKGSSLPVNVFPIGAVSKGTEGKDLAEMYDMHASGAIAFSDGTNPIQSSGLLLKALQYVKAVDATIIQIPDDKTVGTHGLVNEGIMSTRLGLPGKPMMAEELLVARDIKLARYADSKIHFTGVTSPKSLEYIRRAKEGGIAVTCSVAPYHLFFTDEDLVTYNTNLKVYPPLRTPGAVEELRKAVREGVVDCIASHHMPHEYDSKELEFEYAKYGMIGLQTTYSVLKSVMPDLSESRIVELLSINPRQIFGMPKQAIEIDTVACLSLYVPGVHTSYSLDSIQSLSKNSAFAGLTLPGRVVGIVNGNRHFLNPQTLERHEQTA